MRQDLHRKLTEEVVRALRPGEHVLAALSGGADSVALLYLLISARDTGLIRLSAAHFEHGIRGGESVADMRFAMELCEKWNVPFFAGAGDVPGEAKRRGTGLEETARDMRRAFLMQARRDAGADVIALAHHADDQAETVLMRLMRGSGGRGAGGMRERDGKWLRPLLHCRKRELIDYLAQRGQEWREDKTNAEEITERNSLRIRVMGEMERIRPGAIEALGRFADIQRRESDFLDGLAEKWLEENAEIWPQGVRIGLESLPDGVVLARAMKAAAGREATAQDIERLCLLCEKGSGRLDLRGRFFRAEAGAGAVWLLEKRECVKPAPMAMEGATKLADLGTLWAKAGKGAPVRDDLMRQELDTDACEGAHLRLWREGDRIRPLGMNGRSRLLSDIYSDRGVPAPRRPFMPVLEGRDGEILWAIGACIAHGARLTDNCRAVEFKWVEAPARRWKNTKGDGGNDNEE